MAASTQRRPTPSPPHTTSEALKWFLRGSCAGRARTKAEVRAALRRGRVSHPSQRCHGRASEQKSDQPGGRRAVFGLREREAAQGEAPPGDSRGSVSRAVEDSGRGGEGGRCARGESIFNGYREDLGQCRALQDFRQEHGGERRQVVLRLCRRLLALNQQRTGRVTVVMLEGVMDEMRGDGDQIRQQEPSSQCAHLRPAPPLCPADSSARLHCPTTPTRVNRYCRAENGAERSDCRPFSE